MPEQSLEADTRLVFVTCPDHATARRIAHALVEHGEAACVNIVPGIESVYRWQGRIETDAELLLLIKTQARRIGAVETRVAQHHPDDLPEIVAVAIGDGSREYIQWIREQT